MTTPPSSASRAARIAALWNLGLAGGLFLLFALISIIAGPRAVALGAATIAASFAGAAVSAALLAPVFRAGLPPWNALVGVAIAAAAIAAASAALFWVNRWLPPVIEVFDPNETYPDDGALSFAREAGWRNLPFLALGIGCGLHIGRVAAVR